jgi:hypothetical protein
VLAARSTGWTCSAWDARIGDDQLAVAEPTAELVAENERAVEAGVTDARLVVPVEVGAAQANRSDPQPDVVGTCGNLGLARDADVPDAVQAGDPDRRSGETPVRSGDIGRGHDLDDSVRSLGPVEPACWP